MPPVQKYVLMLMVLIGLNGISGPLFAQYSLDGFSLRDSTNYFDEQIGLTETGVILGEYYEYQSRSSTGHPFLQSTLFQSGNIRYRQQNYVATDLLYNIAEHVILTRRTDDFNYRQKFIKLNSEDISHFDMGEMHFVHIPELTGEEGSFFEELFLSKEFGFYQKHHKKESVSGRELTYKTANQYWILDDGKYNEVRSASDIVKLYPELKQSLKSDLKTLGIKRLSRAERAELIELAITLEAMRKS